MLDNSMENYRKLDRKWVLELAEEMSNGRWYMSYEPIVIDPVRGVIQGQHRLWAIIESDTTQLFLVVEASATDDAIGAMDTGKNRTTAVTMSARGVKNAASVVTIARGYQQARMGFMPWDTRASAIRVSTKVISDICKRCPHLHELASITTNTTFKQTGMCGTMAIIAMIAHDDSPGHAFRFVEKYKNAEHISDPNDSVRLLYTRMLKTRASSSTKMPTYIKGGLAAKAYNAFVSGYGVGTLKYTLGETIKIAKVAEFQEV